MITPAEVKFRLEKKLVDLAKDGRPVPVITGVHSIVMIASKAVSAIFDIAPDADGSGLHFQFELPRGVLTREELCDFSAWLASSGFEGTVH
jgi:hypothetical protein